MKKSNLMRLVLFGSGILLGIVLGSLIYVKRPAAMQGENEPEATPVVENVEDDKMNAEDNSITPIPKETPAPADEEPADEEPADEEPGIPEGVWGSIHGAGKSELIGELSEQRVIIIEKKDSGYENAGMQLEESPVDRQLTLIISGVQGGGVSESQVIRISENTICRGFPPTPAPAETPEPTTADAVPTSALTPEPSETPEPEATPALSPDDPLYAWRFDPLEDMALVTEEQENGSFTTSVLMTLDTVYAYEVYEDEWNYYISLLRPKDVYSKIIVIDAGHGALDAGTYSEGYVYLEKNINLNILLYLKEILDEQEEIKVYYTRTTDRKPSLSQRVELANNVEADFFLSVHCNASESKSLNGTEVLYSAAQNSWEGMNSKKFAQICMDKLDQYLGLKNRGLVPRDHNVTIIQDAQVPVALAEVAFMSNKADMEVLAKEETQRNIAQALYEAILDGYAALDADESASETKQPGFSEIN